MTSDIEWKIDLGPFKSFYDIEAIVLREHAKHGLTGVVSTTTLENNPWYAAFVADNLKGRDPLHITTRYGLLGSIESIVGIDPFSVSLEDETIDVKAANLSVNTDRTLESFTSSGKWQGLAVGDAMRIGETTLASTLMMISPFVWEGDIDFELTDVDVRDKNDALRLAKMKLHYLLDVDEDRTESAMQTRLSIEGLASKGMAIDSASVRLGVNGVDLDAYETFMHAYTQTMSRLLGGVTDFDSGGNAVKQQMGMVGFQLLAAYEKLLKKGLAFHISDLNVKLAEAEINGGLNLRLLKDTSFMQFAAAANHPEQLFDRVYLKSDCSLPADLVGENPKLTTPLFSGMQTGLFVKKGKRWVHQAETVEGKLIVNNKEVFLSPRHVQPTAAY